MGRDPKSFVSKTKVRVDDLEGIFLELQLARLENRSSDIPLLEEQVNQMLREWKAELHAPSPAISSSLERPASSELSSGMKRLLQLNDEEDDANSNLLACLAKPIPDHHGNLHPHSFDYELSTFNTVHAQVQTTEDKLVQDFLRSESLAQPPPFCIEESLFLSQPLTGPTLSAPETFVRKGTLMGFPQGNIPVSLPAVSASSPLAFLGPKCALWDCPRPANGFDWCQDYCSVLHANLAMSEGAITSPVMRPGGIDLKDGPLFCALSAKSKHKSVGIPECEGAATSKSPWNAHELFDISVLHGEAIREWLFFDKPRRAFDSGTRKQRSLPDYSGRGWHESRKQNMKELGGLKRSYYMDPQPDSQFEWHLYEYILTDYDVCALYRMELKQVNMSKKGSKSRFQHEQVKALENRIGRLPADLSFSEEKVVFSSVESIIAGSKDSVSYRAVKHSSSLSTRNILVAAANPTLMNTNCPDSTSDDVSCYLDIP